MISYNRLFTMLASRGMKKTDLLDVISAPTLAKLSKGEVVKMDVIEKICRFLNCQPGDIMEYIDEEALKQKTLEMDEMQRKAISQLEAQGVTQEQLEQMMQEAVAMYLKKAFEGGNPITDMVIEQIKNPQNID